MVTNAAANIVLFGGSPIRVVALSIENVSLNRRRSHSDDKINRKCQPALFINFSLARVHFLIFEVCKVIYAFYDMTPAKRELNMIARWLYNGRDRKGLLNVNVIYVGAAESIGRNQLIIWLAEHTWFI